MNQTRPMHSQPMSQSFYQPTNTTFQPRLIQVFLQGLLIYPGQFNILRGSSRIHKFSDNHKQTKIFLNQIQILRYFSLHLLVHLLDFLLILNIIRHLISNQNQIGLLKSFSIPIRKSMTLVK
nr:unnamed protein product [Callosobruchus analis]